MATPTLTPNNVSRAPGISNGCSKEEIIALARLLADAAGVEDKTLAALRVKELPRHELKGLTPRGWLKRDAPLPLTHRSPKVEAVIGEPAEFRPLGDNIPRLRSGNSTTWQRYSLSSKTGKMCGETANKKPSNREYAGESSNYSTPRT